MQKTAVEYEFLDWSRVVSYKYSLDPLSTDGSVIVDPGGRFNIGDIDDTRFPRFPALYLACDLDTALKEAFGLPADGNVDGLTGFQLAQLKGSFTRVSTRGKLHKICDLTKPDLLKPYLQVIKKVTLTKHLTKQCDQYRMKLVQTLEDFQMAVLHPNWRILPQQFDIPSTSQIFGLQLVSAGFEGIKYPSSKDEKLSLAVFPQNFTNPLTKIEIVDECPVGVTRKIIDQSSILTFSKAGSC